MPKNLAWKLLDAHAAGYGDENGELAVKIDQTLTQDATGTMAYLQFEAMGISRVKTFRSVAYIDHNTLQTGFENADDHKYIQTVAKKHGVFFSRPGNGICHQVHLERFGVPGMTLLGSDSHTPTAGGLGMLAFGAGGLDVAAAMGGGAYYIPYPKILRVTLLNSLGEWVAAKDIILELLRRLGVKGGVGKIIEYGGPGVESLSVPERATVTNMGAELGATSSIFPSDEATRLFLASQGRESDYRPLSADPGAEYDEEITVDLAGLEPLAACPHSPDNVKPVRELRGLKIDQCAIGSCTNSSYADMMKTAAILRGRTVHPDVSLAIAPGSKQVLAALAKNGALADMIAAGARILESACGPCIGMGQAPRSGGVSLRTFNRNFEGRSGTADAKVYLVSPETAAVSAITGVLTDPREFGSAPRITIPARFETDDNLIDPPAENENDVEVVRGPNIKPFPVAGSLPERIHVAVLLKVGDNITTDHIMPAGSSILPYRSNIPYLSRFCFSRCDADFPERAKEAGGGIVIGGSNYGQGSSREHAALVPLYLGVKAVIAKSFARIHAANLVNTGILPLTFADPADFDRIRQGDVIILPDVRQAVGGGAAELVATDETAGFSFKLKADFTPRQRDVLLTGGLLNHIRAGQPDK